MKERRVTNKAELEFAVRASGVGWEVTKRGWPDFACYKGRKLILVEVKRARTVHLKREQYRLMLALSKRGIACYRWDPNTGLSQVLPQKAIEDL